MENHFRIFGFIDLEKSLQVAPETEKVDSAYKDFILRGRVLNAVKDAQNETPIIPEMDWSYFDKHGFVKYEHDPIEVVMENEGKRIQKSTPDPENIIGAPLRRARKSDKEEFIEAALFTGMDKARGVVKLVKALQEHNRRFPNNQRTIGWSVEGQYLKMSRDGKYAGRVINLAITPNPQDLTTYVEQVQKSNLSFAKSLEAGYGVTPETKTDGGALRRESLEGSPDKKANSQKRGEKKMEHFASRQEAYAHHRGKGLSKEDAKKKVEEHFAAVGKAREDEQGGAEKSITNALASLSKSIEMLGAIQTSREERAAHIVSFDVELKKSVAALNANEEVDGAKFLANQGQAIVEVADMIREGQVESAKTDTEVVKGITEVVNLVKSLYSCISDVREQV